MFFKIIRELYENEIKTLPSSINGLTNLKEL